MDMRILPMYSVDEVMTSIHRLMERYEKDFPGIYMDVEFLTRTDAPEPTSPESKVARSLVEAISETGTKAYSGGIGAVPAERSFAQERFRLLYGQRWMILAILRMNMSLLTT